MLCGFESCEYLTYPQNKHKKMFFFSSVKKVNIENESWFYTIVFVIVTQLHMQKKSTCFNTKQNNKLTAIENINWMNGILEVKVPKITRVCAV